MMNFFFFGKSVLFDQKKPGDRPGTGEKKSKKFEKFWLDELPARPDRTGTGPVAGPAPREEGAGATDEREVAPAAWGGGKGGPAR